MNPEEQVASLTSTERRIAGLIGVGALLFAIYLMFCPPLRISEVLDPAGVPKSLKAESDQSSTVIVLFTVAGAFFFYALNGLRLTKFTAGPISGESESRQGVTRLPSPPPQAPTTSQASPSSEAVTTFLSLTEEQKKILRTLWRYQTSNFGSEFSNRWTFKVLPNAPDYPNYLAALPDLIRSGYVTVTPNDQCALTNEGIVLMTSIGDHATTGSFYIF